MIAALENVQMERLLREQSFARLGCHADGETYVVPISYVYDPENNRLLGQTTQGKKIEMMRSNPNVCIEIDDVASLTHWESVILWGKFVELRGADAAKAMGLLIDRYAPIFEGESRRRGREVTPPPLGHTPAIQIVYSVQIDRMSGRCEDGFAKT